MIAYNLNDTVGKAKEVGTLYLRNLGLTELPEVIREMKNLKILGLGKNRISKLPDWIKELTRLEYLDFSYNRFEEFPTIIFELSNIKGLNFSGNQLQEIPKAIGRFKFLGSFLGRENQLKKIPKELFSKTLKDLDLSNNQITKIPKTLQKAIHLDRLYFTNNQITELPSIDYVELSISHIFLTENNLKTLPENIGDLKKLRNLRVRGNKIKTIPDSIGACKYLWDLDVRQNKIETLPNSIVQCRWLHELFLQKNKITSLPDEIGHLKKLRKLNLEYNQLQSLPSSIINLTYLEHLLLKGNDIRFPKIEFIHFERLNKLTGLANLFSTGEKRKLISFLKYCKREKIEVAQRKQFFELYTENKRLSKSDLIEATNFPIQKIRQNAISQLFKYYNSKTPITTNSVLHFSGHTYRVKKKIISELRLLKIKHQLRFNENVTHIVLGDFPNKATLQNAEEATLVSEQELLRFIQPNLEVINFSSEELDNLKRLLLSSHKENLLIGIQILENTYVPSIFITDLFIAQRICSISSIRKKLRSYLMLYASPALRDKLNTSQRLPNKIVVENDKWKFAKFIKGTELDLERVIEFFTVGE